MTTALAIGKEAARLDTWLAADREMSRHAARTLIDAGYVLVNGRVGRPATRVHAQDTVEVRVPEQQLGQQSTDDGITAAVDDHAAANLLNVVYEDEWLAVIDKPAGLVVHPAPGHPNGTLADMLRDRGTVWSLLGGQERPGVVHRLDRDTSGLLVVAKSEAAHRALAQQLKERTLGRTYIAIVHGGFKEASGTIDAPIGRDPRNRKRMAVVERGRPAVTDFRVVERLGNMTVLDVQLRTGRTHQIRTHMAYIRHPVVGDTVYGKSEPAINRPALHASRLVFRHPGDGELRGFESPLPRALQMFLERLRRSRR